MALEAGLVTAARRGRWIDYALAGDALSRLHAALPGPPAPGPVRPGSSSSSLCCARTWASSGPWRVRQLHGAGGRTREAVEALGLRAAIEKVTDPAVIAGYGVMRTPALVVDDEVVPAGRVPGTVRIRGLLTAKPLRP